MDRRVVVLARRILPRPLLARLRRWLGAGERLAAAERAQRLLARAWLLREHGGADGLDRWEAKVHSQNGEDGILLHLFSRIGTTNRTFVEFGCGGGLECNASNLLLHWGWRGVLLDADPAAVAAARATYDRHLGERRGDAVVAAARITRENVDRVLAEHALDPRPDLLSIDIDGNDYWVWRALSALEPRVVVIEYNAALGPERSVTVAYDDPFDRWARHPSGLYHGASLSALAALGRDKGYALVGCDSCGVNAFFVRRELLGETLREVAPDAAWRPLAPEHSRLGPAERAAIAARLPFEEV